MDFDLAEQEKQGADLAAVEISRLKQLLEQVRYES